MNESKEKKVHKSSKKSKHKKNKKLRRRSSSSDTRSDSAEAEWVEAPAPKIESNQVKRDDWMQEESFVSTFTREDIIATGTSSREKKRLARESKLQQEEEVKKQRELNPHWQDNGSGLPNTESSMSVQLPSSSVGDGGYSYLKKAYIRIQEQAQREGRSMEELAVERWGSLSKLESMIDEAESRMQQNSKSKYSSDRRDRKEDNKNSHYSSRLKKPRHSPSPSPERSVRYEKPKHYERNRKKICNVSSSSTSKNTKANSERVRDSKEFARSWTSGKKSESESSGSESEKSNIKRKQDRDQIPTWKKRESYDDRNSTNFHEADVKKHAPSWKKSVSETEICVQQAPPRKASPQQINTKTEEPKFTSETIHSEDDLNRLAAKYLKAELMGNKELTAKLKLQLDEAREQFKAGTGSMQGRPQKRERERVMLTKMDSTGQQRPVQSSREEDGFERRTGQKQRSSNKSFDDAGRYSLKSMFEREKLTTADDHLEMFMDVSGQCKDSLEENETSGISKKATAKMDHCVQEEKDIGKAIHQHQKMNAALEKCEYCVDQPNMKRHLIVSMHEQMCICIPNYQSLTKGHCLIVPKRHVSSFLALDEDEWAEYENMKCLLRRFFKEQGKSMLCLETSLNFRWFPHAVVECIPLPEEDGDMAPFYFKKAILESEEEWTHNIKLVDLSKKGLRRSVPKNLPYFCVLFDPAVHAGYAHVIEDEKAFPRNFGKEVIGGMLDIDYNLLYKNRKDDPLKKSNEALEFSKQLEAFQADKS